MEIPDESDKQNKVTEAVVIELKSSSSECAIGRNTDTDITETEAVVIELKSSSSECAIDRSRDTDITETEAVVTELKSSSSECAIDKNPDTDITETEAFVTELKTASSECAIDRNPDTDITEISVLETRSSIPVVQPEKDNKNNEYRDDSDSWSDDDDSSSTSDTSSDSDFCQILIDSSAPKKAPLVKTKGELGLEDLPPIEDLVISVEEEETMLIGKIHAVVDKLVVIHAIKDMKPLDLDSVLFLSHDKPLGRVFDIFGPVVEPFYCVRFNSTDDINDKGVEVGSDVFFAPEKSDITTYVFVDELQRQKGSDASWKNNNEPPEEFLDFSDDEEEKAARRRRITKNRNRQFSNNSDVASKRPSLAGNSSPQSNYRNSAHPSPPRSNIQYNPFTRHNSFSTPPLAPLSPSPSICSVFSNPAQPAPPRSNIQCNPFARHNPFSTPALAPPLSPTPSICSVISNPVRVRNSFNRFSTPNQTLLPFSQPQRPYPQNILQRSPSLVFTTYPQPPVFGQMAVLSPMPSPSPFHSPVTNNISTLIPTSHAMTPQSYFNQRFPRNPSPLAGNPRVYFDQGFPRSSSPVSPGQQTLPDPWLPNRPPGSFHVPPTHPLTIQIPNQNSHSTPLRSFRPDSISLQPPFVNNNINLHNGNVQTRFY